MEILDEENGNFKKLVIIRSAVTGRDVGALPGDLDEKLSAYELPYREILSELTGKKYAYDKLKEIGKIEFMSTSYLRGLTLKDSIIVFDESQNVSWVEASSVLTRLHDSSRIIICGDSKQNDLHFKKSDQSGFLQMVEVLKRIPEARCFKFTSDDIVRSGFCKSFICACEEMGI